MRSKQRLRTKACGWCCRDACSKLGKNIYIYPFSDLFKSHTVTCWGSAALVFSLAHVASVHGNASAWRALLFPRPLHLPMLLSFTIKLSEVFLPPISSERFTTHVFTAQSHSNCLRSRLTSAYLCNSVCRLAHSTVSGCSA